MKCKPCKVTFQGQRYQVFSNGAVAPVTRNVATVPGGVDTWSIGAPVNTDQAKAIRAEASRQRRNRNARERHQGMTDLGLVRNRDGSYE